MLIIAALEAAGHTNVDLRWESPIAPGVHQVNRTARGSHYVFTSSERLEPTDLGRTHAVALVSAAIYQVRATVRRP